MGSNLGLEKHKVGDQFGVRELGLIDGPPLRGAKTVVKTTSELFDVSNAALIIFDDAEVAGVVRVASDPASLSSSYPLDRSIASLVRASNASQVVSSLSADHPDAPEYRLLSMKAVLACPVYGPDTEPVGALAAFDTQPRAWTKEQKTKLESLAHLISQELILRASFETLRIMARERGQMSSVNFV